LPPDDRGEDGFGKMDDVMVDVGGEIFVNAKRTLHLWLTWEMTM
jgi:hypothetical protein